MSDDDRRRRVMEALTRALDTAPAVRPGVIEEICGGDASLREEVEELLGLEEEAEDFLPESLLSIPDGSEAKLDAGARIGPYRVTELIGRGGMGAVYRAVREDDFQIEVAIKLVRYELMTPAAVRRFHAERQILARFEHPSIARLLDGGTTEDGTPYLVMEYVDGVPVDRYCNEHRLSSSERLALFVQAADAVAYAHQNLVVHRDLKPSNVLVNAAGVPKLLDFGIAKLLEGDSEAPAARTPTASAMTPRYASPEQVVGDPVTAASDVYSLGVVLYQVLTGRLPCDLDTCAYDEISRRILEQEPQRPSTVTGPSREGKPGDGRQVKLRRRLAGDVDAIVLKALRKEPKQRYASVEQLTDDIRRYLDGRPVRARKGTWTYRAGKLVRRSKLATAAALAVLSLSVTSTLEWRRAEVERGRADRERAEAVRERTRAERVSQFLKELFKSANPDAARGEALTVHEVLDQGRARLAEDLGDEPELRAALSSTLGDVYRNLGLYDEARQLLESAVRIRRAERPDAHPELAIDLNDLASVYYYLGQWAQAERWFREALEMRRRLGQGEETIARTLNNLASAVRRQGRFDEAEELYRQSLAIREKILDGDDPELAASLYSVGALYYERGELEPAEPLLRRALEIYVGSEGEVHTRCASVMNTLGRLLLAAGELEQAEAFQRRALEIRAELFGEGHHQVALTRKDLAEVLLERGEVAAAGELLEGSLEVLRSSPGVQEWAVAETESVYGTYLTVLERYDEAEPLVLSGLAAVTKARGEGSIRARRARTRAADLYEKWGRPEKAAAYRSPP